MKDKLAARKRSHNIIVRFYLPRMIFRNTSKVNVIICICVKRFCFLILEFGIILIIPTYLFEFRSKFKQLFANEQVGSQHTRDVLNLSNARKCCHKYNTHHSTVQGSTSLYSVDWLSSVYITAVCRFHSTDNTHHSLTLLSPTAVPSLCFSSTPKSFCFVLIIVLVIDCVCLSS